MRAFVLVALLALAAGLAPAAGPVTPEAERRGEDQTFLTYPEWFLVYSAVSNWQNGPEGIATRPGLVVPQPGPHTSGVG